MKTTIFATLLFCLALAAVGQASAQTSRFHGHWTNVDLNTSGLAALDIKVNGLDVDVKAWGNCTLHPCDVGSTDAHIYAPSADDGLKTKASALTVHYKESFANRLLVIEPRGTQLSVTMFTHFTDGSHRTNYVEHGLFKR